jgi:uncharacterized protein with PIN domain
MTEPTSTGGLWPNVDSLTKPTRHRLTRDDGATDWADVPSLWDQLSQCIATGSEGGSRAKPGSKPPVDTESLALRLEIEWLIAGGCHDHGLKVDRDEPADTRVPKDIRRLASAIVTKANPAAVTAATTQLGKWAHRIRTTIGDGTKPARRLRGHRCITCGTEGLRIRNSDGDTTIVPPLMLTFSDDGQVRCATCEACGVVYWRGDDLHRLAEQAMPAVSSAHPNRRPHDRATRRADKVGKCQHHVAD